MFPSSCVTGEKPDPRVTLQLLISIVTPLVGNRLFPKRCILRNTNISRWVKSFTPAVKRPDIRKRCSDPECPRLFSPMSAMRTVNSNSLSLTPYLYQVQDVSELIYGSRWLICSFNCSVIIVGERESRSRKELLLSTYQRNTLLCSAWVLEHNGFLWKHLLPIALVPHTIR
jgi:hypothetical protein